MTVLAKPVRLEYGVGYLPCAVEEATHVTLHIPGPVGMLTLPVMLKGTREGTGNWTWNGSTTAPTLRPSVLNTGHAHRCHTWITDGQAQYLDDCSHDLRGQTVPLNPVDQPPERRTMKTTITTLAAVAAMTLSGCSGTIGALCYIPADSTGQCAAATVKEPIRTVPVLPAAKS